MHHQLIVTEERTNANFHGFSRDFSSPHYGMERMDGVRSLSSWKANKKWEWENYSNSINLSFIKSLEMRWGWKTSRVEVSFRNKNKKMSWDVAVEIFNFFLLSLNANRDEIFEIRPQGKSKNLLFWSWYVRWWYEGVKNFFH